MMNPGQFIRRNALYHRDDAALMYHDSVTTYGELERRTNRLVNALRALKIRRGDRVAVQSGNRPEIAEVEIACFKGGFVKVPVNARFSLDETTGILKNSGAVVVIGDGRHLEPLMSRRKAVRRVRVCIGVDGCGGDIVDYEECIGHENDDCDIVEAGDDDLAVLAYSSGTSGGMKAIMQTYGNRMAMIRKAFMIPEVKILKNDVFAHVGPITHASGMLMMPVMAAAGCNLIMDGFDVKDLLETIERKRVNYIFLVPAMINMILAHPEIGARDTGSLKGIFYGAAPMSAARIKEAIDRFGPILVQGYGLTETTSFSTILTAGDHTLSIKDGNHGRLMSCGRPVFESELRVVDEKGREAPVGETGEIVIRGPDVMKGYYRNYRLTRTTLRGGWLHTGDIARMDGEGYVYIVDRKNDMIISGGFNVFPSEVEQVLSEHEAVHETCVVGVPDELWGEAVRAVVVLRKGHRVTADELIEFCGQRLAGYKKPRSIEFAGSLPKNPNGKVARRVVRERFWGDETRRVH